MTCVIGLVDNDKTYIGVDSLGSNGYTKTVRMDEKAFKLKDTSEAIIGYTSSFRMGQLLMYATDLIDDMSIIKNKINHEYLVTKFIPKVITLFETGGFISNSGTRKGGEFLFAYKNNLYKIESDFQVGQSVDNYDACGCGEDFALGSLKTTEDTNLTPIERIHKALQAASKFSVGVSAPYYIINTKDDTITKFDK